MGKYLIAGGMLLAGCNGGTANSTIRIPAIDAEVSEAGHVSNEAGAGEAGQNQNGPGVDGGTGLDGVTGIGTTSTPDGSATGIDGGVTDDSGTPVGDIDGSIARDGGVGQTGIAMDGPGYAAESGLDISIDDGGAASSDTAPGITVDGATSVNGETGSVAVVDGGVYGEAGGIDSEARHDAQVATSDAKPNVCNEQSAGDFTGYIYAGQSESAGSLSFTYNGVITTDAGATVYDVDVSCGSGPATKVLLTSGANALGGGISVNVTEGGPGSVYVVIKVEAQSQDAGADVGSPVAIDTGSLDVDSCTGTGSHSGYINYTTSATVGGLTFKFEGTGSTDGGAMSYDVGISGNGSSTSVPMVDGVNTMKIGDKTVTINVVEGGKGEIYVDIAVNCP